MKYSSRFRFCGLLLIVGLGASLLYPVRAQQPSRASDRPGDAAYKPTKLEWAALELQATYGNPNWTRDTPVVINFVPGADGKTVICLFQYTANATAAMLKMDKDTEQSVFEKYIKTRGWAWLRLEVREQLVGPGTSQ
jgi:hypothetical protein